MIPRCQCVFIVYISLSSMHKDEEYRNTDVPVHLREQPADDDDDDDGKKLSYYL